MAEFPEKLEVLFKTDSGNWAIAIEDNGELFEIDLSIYPPKDQPQIVKLIDKLVHRWNEHDSLKAKADSQPALLKACEELVTAPAIRMAIKALRDIDHEGICIILQARADKARAAIAVAKAKE